MQKLEFLKEDFKKNDFNPVKVVLLNYKILVKSLYISIPLILLLLANYFHSFESVILLKIFIYSFVFFWLDGLIYGKKKYNLKRLVVFFVSIIVLQLVPFSYIFLMFPFMVLTRKLKIKEALSLSSYMIIKNIVKFFVVIAINALILTVVIFLVTTFLRVFVYKLDYSEVEKIKALITSNLMYYEFLVNYILATQFYIIYRILEYTEIMKKEEKN
ncbi:hypothetical protein [Oceanivirga miroungae]|uniref:Uncharacterized protein n=1 Tax=Oceanivirga miroungae TaxID=1130046 RepID=A0A6I8MD88_9FUSO|nr:hypothetical protein [Oceanivirga miroungae]VWL85060.1 hypothetical protein OMES3154_00336 [Oceanivirga miroungae]